MAGSYKHIVNADGSFRGVDLLDHLGDAYDALEECHAMIQWLTGGDKRKIWEAWRKGYFDSNCPPENADYATFEKFWGNG